ncbi:hypothetical protein AVEN_259162-1 [Araneus ventricosus]|uniref:BTB domain-containing protein n=1 Tax=Araneus ventricosus TaxID=182803 RepID=A0A4Y2RRF0_ARAVE|nr:hypothetical protein AVEN_259162-1 [Araneus ventricosus]
MTYRRSFVWAIEEFSLLHSIAAEDFKMLASDEIKVYTLKPFSSMWPSMALILYLKRSYGLENVNADFVTGEGRDYAFSCEISILDANGKVIVSNVENGCMKKSLKFCSLISRSKLMANRNLLVPNDTLLLRCTFEIPFGNISSRIEYCTPNVSSGVPPTFNIDLLSFDLHFAAENNPVEFEEYLINKVDDNDSSNMATETNPIEFEEYLINKVDDNDSLNIAAENNPLEFEDDPVCDDPFDDYDSPNCSKKSKNITDYCRDSCTLRTALKHLYDNTTMSDISLKIGTKCYPVHRNILCSRSPVFEKILDNDIVQKTIEIEDMDENTLCRLLQYIYTDTVEDLDFTNALDLYKAADYYQLLDLRNKCSYFLGNNLHEANLSEIISLAKKCQVEELEKRVRGVQEFHRKIEAIKQSGPTIDLAEMMQLIVNNDFPSF